MDGKNRGLGNLLMFVAVVAFAAVVALTVLALRDLGGQYQAALASEPQANSVYELSFNDRFFSSLGRGIQIDPAADPHQELAEFLEESLRAIQLSVLAMGILYAIVTSILTGPFIANRTDLGPGFVSNALGLTGMGMYLAYVAAVVAGTIVFGMPFYIPRSAPLLALLAGILGIKVGNNVVGALLGRIDREGLVVLAAVIAVPVAVALFFGGFFCENGLFCDAKIESFDYVSLVDERILDEDFDGARYDEERNVLVVEGTEYQPELLDNPEHFSGAVQAGAIAFEVLSPYSGCSLELSRQAFGVQTVFLPLFALRNLVVSALLRLWRRHLDA